MKKIVRRFIDLSLTPKLIDNKEARDPRFLFAAGEFRADKYQDNYGFLAEIHGNELKTLRENLKRARKMLDNAPRDLRDEYEAEVERLELAVKRAESIVNRERADKVQREALQKVSKGENEKRKQGKGSWYLKKCKSKHLFEAVLLMCYELQRSNES